MLAAAAAGFVVVVVVVNAGTKWNPRMQSRLLVSHNGRTGCVVWRALCAPCAVCRLSCCVRVAQRSATPDPAPPNRLGRSDRCASLDGPVEDKVVLKRHYVARRSGWERIASSRLTNHKLAH